MSLPEIRRLLKAAEATWPPAARKAAGPFVIREGLGGGQRVSAATLDGEPAENDELPAHIGAAEEAMRALGQEPLFMIRPQDLRLDAALAGRGYGIKDPVNILAAPVDALAEPLPPVSAFSIWPPLAIMCELWDEGGIGPARRAVMERACRPKTAILARSCDRAAGVAFAAIHEGIAMVHALEVTPALRRQGVGRNIMHHAANWARKEGATHLAVLVTKANAAAGRLYASLGMEIVGEYHYRVQQGETRADGEE